MSTPRNAAAAKKLGHGRAVAESPKRQDVLGLERIHVVLVGFMGAGKSSVGKALAARSGMTFVDLDEVISTESEKTIPEIFRDHGEVGFRARERSTLRQVLARPNPHVIATGGGTFVDPMMRDWIQASGRSVYLQASADVLLQRIGTGPQRQGRPLLGGPDPEDTIRRLLSERLPVYETCDFTVNTDDWRLDQVVDHVRHQLRLNRQRTAGERRIGPAGRAHRNTAASTDVNGNNKGELASAKPIEVPAEHHTYQVHIRADAGPWIAAEIAKVCRGSRIAIITDTNVASLHSEPLIRDLSDLGKQVSLHSVGPGESSKSLETAGRLYDELIEHGLDRSDAIVALGGGLIGDLAGFVAATLLRGIAFAQVPTTTLGAVDASIGGKNAVNTRHGKNLVGTIHAPAAVLVAISHLATQPRREHAAGLVEALKMAATLDAALFDALTLDAHKLLDFDVEPLLLALRRSIALKAEVVARDEHETGDRAVLNYGHTVGHAIEVGEEFRLLHGEAVALGMMAEASWADAEGISTGLCAQLGAGLEAFGMKTTWRQATVQLDAIGVDKKRVGTNIRLPVIPKLGTYEIRTVPISAVVEFIRGRSKK